MIFFQGKVVNREFIKNPFFSLEECMRFIQDLTNETIHLLERLYKRSRYPRVRQRAQCILLSHEGYTVSELVRIFRVDRMTIYNWFNTWETRRFPGLYDRPGKGNTPKLTPTQREQVKAWAQEFPRKIGKLKALIQETFDIVVSSCTIRRMLKALGVTWRRVRRKVKGAPDPQEYEQKQQELEALQTQHDKGEIDLRYVDQSGFCLIPLLPYAWQVKGETIELPSSSSRKRLNVIGFLNTDNVLQAYTFECTIDSEIMIACIDDLAQQVTKPTVLVMDQASIHTSEAFMDCLPRWKEQGIEIFHLPTYSPELNLIEHLWRFIKYEWLDFDAYESWKHLVAYVEDVLRNVGTEYKINFA
jgi:transposase